MLHFLTSDIVRCYFGNVSFGKIHNPPSLLTKQTTRIPHPNTFLRPLQSDFHPASIPCTCIASSVRSVQGNINTRSHQQTRDQVDGSPRADLFRIDQLDLHRAVAAGPGDGEPTYVAGASRVEGNGLGVLREGEDRTGAVLYEAEAQGEDAEGVTTVGSGRVGGCGDVCGSGGDCWEKEGEGDEVVEGKQIHLD